MRGKLRLWTAPTRFGIGIYHREAKLNEIRRLLAKKNYPTQNSILDIFADRDYNGTAIE